MLGSELYDAPGMTEGLNADWNLSRMLDELWLRVRRTFIHKLDASNLWIHKSQYELFLENQKSLGLRLRDKWLLKSIGQEDYLSLHSERSYRGANLKVRTKVPLVMALGHDFGAGLTALCKCNSPRCNEAAILCAIFNLGIALFDVIVDNFPSLIGTLGRHFNENILRDLGSDDKACIAFQTLWANVEDDEVRILLKIVASFFINLHRLSATAQCREQNNVLPLLEKAYRSELMSAEARGNSEIEPWEVSKTKSTLPFIVMGYIACLGAEFADEASVSRTIALAAAIGEIFWLTDDLIDLVRDLRIGSVNSILSECGLGPSARRDRSGLYVGVMGMLSGGYVENKVDDIVCRLSSLDALLWSCQADHYAISRFRSFVLGYIRCWVT